MGKTPTTRWRSSGRTTSHIILRYCFNWYSLYATTMTIQLPKLFGGRMDVLSYSHSIRRFQGTHSHVECRGSRAPTCCRRLNDIVIFGCSDPRHLFLLAGMLLSCCMQCSIYIAAVSSRLVSTLTGLALHAASIDVVHSQNGNSRAIYRGSHPESLKAGVPWLSWPFLGKG